MNGAAERFFFDTNVWLYSVDPADGGKRELLLSEDFQAGQKFGGITVVNPFRTGPEEYGLG